MPKLARTTIALALTFTNCRFLKPPETLDHDA